MKVCIQCGSPLQDDARFCKFCGRSQTEAAAPPAAPLQGGPAQPQPGYVSAAAPAYTGAPAYGSTPPYGGQPVYAAAPPYGTPAMPARKKRGKLVLVLALVAVVVAVALVLVLVLPGGGGGQSAAALRAMEAEYTFLYTSGEESARAYYDGARFVDEGDYDGLPTTDIKGEVNVAVDYYSGSSGDYELYVLDRDYKEVFSAEDVSAHVMNYRTGALYYMTSGRSPQLYRWIGGAGAELLVDDAVEDMAFSPGDNALLLVMDGDLFTLHPGGQPQPVETGGRGVHTVGISDDGQFIYWVESGSGGIDLYCQANGVQNSISNYMSGGSHTSYIRFNASATEFLVNCDKGLYVCQNGAFEKITSQNGDIVYANFGYFQTYTSQTLPSYVYYNAVDSYDSFAYYLYDSGKLCHYSRSTGSVEIDRDVTHAQAGADFGIIYYMRDGSLRKATMQGGTPHTERVAPDVVGFHLSRDGQHLRYLVPQPRNEDYLTLYYQKEGGAAEELASGLGRYLGCFWASADGAWCAWVADVDLDDDMLDGRAYLCKAGGTPTEVGRAAMVLAVGNDGSMYYTSNHSYYQNTEGHLHYYNGTSSETVDRYYALTYSFSYMDMLSNNRGSTWYW